MLEFTEATTREVLENGTVTQPETGSHDSEGKHTPNSANWAAITTCGYHIYPLGCCGAPWSNQGSATGGRRLESLFAWMDHAAWLGAGFVYLGPLFESHSHGYDTIDYRRVDQRLGDEELLKELVAYAHARGLKVLFDAVFNHVGTGFFAVQDVQRHGMSSGFRDWICGLQIGADDHLRWDTWGGHHGLVKLNLSNREVRNYLLATVDWWKSRFGIDGLRLDAADVMDKSFLRELSGHCRERWPDFLVLSEVIHGDYREWCHHPAQDAVTNYEAWKGLYSSCNDANLFEIAWSLNRQFGPEGMYRGMNLYSFADNHDVDRLCSTLKDSKHVYPVHILLFCMPGIPSIYYGSEWGLTGTRAPDHDWPLRPCLEPQGAGSLQQALHPDLVFTIKKLVALRSRHRALQCGDYRQLHVASRQFAFLRTVTGMQPESAVVMVNIDSTEAGMAIDHLPDGIWVDVLNGGEQFAVHGGRLACSIPPFWGRILVQSRD